MGRMPPPIGGVSVYCKRRIEYLRSNGVDVKELDFGDRFFLFKYLFLGNRDLEVNSLNLLIVFLVFVTGRMKSSIFIDHNASRHFSGKKKKLLLFMLEKCKAVKVVNEMLTSFYPKHFEVILTSPFVPPPLVDEKTIFSTYPDSLKKFIENGKLVINSAWKMVPYKNNDLYGIKTSLDLLNIIDDFKLLIVIGVYEKGMFDDKYSAIIEKFENSQRLYILKGQYDIWPLIKAQPICLRLTPTDGDSVTIREAIYFGAPVIASDAIVRPFGCHIYEYGNINSLKECVEKLL
nr:glycosyltransferase [Pseudoalteromonas sp. BSi20480]|tara:strand:- start:765 stop:1634 length:870 start_codon:yes stop_codon:yes gene_type:complete